MTDENKDSAHGFTPDEELTPEQRAAHQLLQEYSQAIREEHEEHLKTVVDGSSTATKVIESNISFVLNNMKHAFANIVNLMHNAESESVQLNASKWLASLGLQLAAKEAGGVSPLEKLFADLRTNENSGDNVATPVNDK